MKVRVRVDCALIEGTVDVVGHQGEREGKEHSVKKQQVKVEPCSWVPHDS